MHTKIYEVKDGDFIVSNNPEKLDIDVVHGFLTTSYWSAGIEQKVVERAIRGSVCFGLYHLKTQIGFARVITDFISFGYLADVFILEEYQGKGLGSFLIKTIKNHPSLAQLRKWMLATKDAHSFYEKFDFIAIPNPQDYMECRPVIEINE
ncbi:MAG: N-acetyltransferase [Calditrichaeota bacterium]|nr:MAG: N-acetyltransferase [Calditrichota bacterium]